MNFNFQNKDNMNMFSDLGKTVAKIASRTPGGFLIFFPSYRLMEQTYEQWEKNDIIDEI